MFSRFTTPRCATRWWVAVAAVLLSQGCAPESLAPTPDDDASRLFWGLTLDQHAITLSTAAPYDATRLTATPRTWDGSPLSDAPPVTFSVSDPSRLEVDADGTIRAVAPGAGLIVIASLRIGNIRHADTAVVDVVTDPAPPSLDAFSIQPVPPDSAIWGANELEFSYLSLGPKLLAAHDGTGAPIGVRVHYTSSDTTIARVGRNSGELSGVRPGRVRITASSSAYGVVRADTVEFTITMPAFQTVLMLVDPDADTSGVYPHETTLAAGGVVLFFDYSLEATEVRFDDPTHVAEDQLFCFCGAGNIPSFTYEDIRTRSFPVPGTYVWHSTLRPGMTGKIVVVPPPAASGSAARGVR